MPKIPTGSTARPRNRTIAILAGLTLAVLLGHWAVLFGTPLGALRAEPTSAVDRPFTMRTISTAAPADTPVAPRAQARPRVAPAPAKPAAPAAGAPDASEISEVNRPEKPMDSAQAAPESIATPDATTEGPVQLAAANTPASSTEELVVNRYVIPGSTRLKYDVKGEVKGFPYFANGELLWLQDGKTYDARLEISHFLLGSRVQTSKGQLTPQGLEPIRFGDKVRSEVAAHFEYGKGKVTFSANTPDAPLQMGAQDQLSVFIQLASMLGGEKERVLAGDSIPFQAVGPRSSEGWIFKVGEPETLALPGGAVKAVKLTRDPTGEHDPKVEVWLAPDMDFMPVRIRLSQPNGDFVEQQWRATQKP
jgi:hypothetical protein